MEKFNTATTAMESVEQTAVGPRPIEVITAEIWLYKQRAGADVLEIGRRLLEAKETLNHGEWLPWLEEKVEFSEATAQRFMRLAKEYPNPSLVTDLGASKALVLLALPASEREEFVSEKHTVNGAEKTVAEMSRRELETAIRERDAARKQVADLQADLQTQLEEQRTVYDVDTQDLRAQIAEAENRAQGFEMKLKAEKDRAAAEQKQAEDEIAGLKAQLEALEAAPKDVAVETVVDQDAVAAAAEQARKEAEEKLRTKIEKAKKAKEKAEKDKAKAEQDLAALKVAQEEQAAITEREKQAMAEQVQALQKKLAVASSSEMTIFKLHFVQAQESINKMADCIQRIVDAGDADGGAKLKNALAALLNTTLDVLK